MNKKLNKRVPELRFSEYEGNWEDKTLAEVANVQTGPFGSQLKNEQYITGGTPVVTVEHIKDFWINNFDYPSVTDKDRRRLRKYSLEPGDIVFSRVGSVDLSACVEDYQEGWLFSSRMLRVRPNQQLKSKFLAYFLQQTKIRRYIIRISVGSTMPSLNTEILQSLPIKYCSLAEQEKIASFLGSIDTRLTQLYRKHEVLQTYKRGVMQKIFSQELRFKDAIGSNFPDWKEKKLEQVSTITMGQSPESESYNSNGVGKYLIQGNADICNRITKPKQWTSEPTKLCENGDLILTVRAPIGMIAKSNTDACLGRGVCSLKILSNSSKEFLYQFLLYYEPQWISLGQGSTFTAINAIDIKSLKISYPCIDEQDKIASFLTVIDRRLEAVAQKIYLTEQFKKGLLQKMFV